MLNAFYTSKCNRQACDYTIAFTDTTGIDVCDNSPDCAAADDGNQVVGPNTNQIAAATDLADDGTDDYNTEEYAGSKRSAGTDSNTKTRRYITSTGRDIVVPQGASIGQRSVWMEPRNATLWEEQAENMGLVPRHGFEDDEDEDENFEYAHMARNLVVREDVIVKEIF